MEENQQHNNPDHEKSMSEKLKESIETRQAQQARQEDGTQMPQQKKEGKSGVIVLLVLFHITF